MEGMVANSSRIHKGANPKKHGINHSGEQVYQLELQVYQTTFPNFKYEPPSFVSTKIRSNNKTTTTTTPFVVQPIVNVKLVSPLRGGTCLEIIPLPI
jgi:hypothetical protein